LLKCYKKTNSLRLVTQNNKKKYSRIKNLSMKKEITAKSLILISKRILPSKKPHQKKP